MRRTWLFLVVVSLAVVGCGAEGTTTADDPALSRLEEGSEVVLFDKFESKLELYDYAMLSLPPEQRRPEVLPVGTKVLVIEDSGNVNDPNRTVEIRHLESNGKISVPLLPKRSQLRPAR
jgi:hypothetical protein